MALFANEIDGVIDHYQRLLQIATQPDQIQILDESIAVEHYAVMMPYGDIQLRNFVNRTLQIMFEEGDLKRLHDQYFPSREFIGDQFSLWANLGEDAPKPEQFSSDIAPPANSIIDRIASGQPLRVAGVWSAEDGTERENRVNTMNGSLVDQLAQQWGVSVQFVDGNPIELVATGQADMAVGIQPDWNEANRVDFTSPYLLHGDRLMVPRNSSITGFNDLRGQWIGIIREDEGAEARAREWADSINATVNIYTTREADAVHTILVDHNADVIYGDNLRLLPHLEANPRDVKLTDRWYSQTYMAIAIPPNDIPFQRLVNYSLQDMVVNGRLRVITTPVMLPDEAPSFEVWLGDVHAQDLLVGS